MTCDIDGNQFIISDDDLSCIVIKSEDPITVQVSVIVRVRVAGVYQCFVTTDRITSTPLTATTPVRNITGKNTLNIILFIYSSLSLNSNCMDHQQT